MNIVHQSLTDIYARHGELKPEIVVSEAENPDHPLHDRFTWEDGEAAHYWRLHEAQHLIRQVKVIVERPGDSEPIKVRAFIAQQELGTDAGSGPGAYRPVEEVITDDMARAAWFAAMRRDWERLRRKYEVHQEFADMVLADLRGVSA